MGFLSVIYIDFLKPETEYFACCPLPVNAHRAILFHSAKAYGYMSTAFFWEEVVSESFLSFFSAKLFKFVVDCIDPFCPSLKPTCLVSNSRSFPISKAV